MKSTILLMLSIISIAAQALDPVNDFKSKMNIENGDKIVKFSIDVNGDEKNEILLCSKSSMNYDKEQNDPPSWHFYIAVNSGAGFAFSEETENAPGRLTQSDLPPIDPAIFFAGNISEIGKFGIVTMRRRAHRPLDGETITIYAYTIEGDHLKKHQLTQYEEGESNAVFNKYLAEDKRTHVQLQEIDP